MGIHKITLRVEAREYIPGTVRTSEFVEECVISVKTVGKKAILNTLRRQYGRCVGLLQLPDFGYMFEGKLRTDDGSVTWWETRVTIIDGVRALPGYLFEKEVEV